VAHNAGVSIAGVTVDFTGLLRLVSAPDIGAMRIAYQYCSAA